MNIFFKKYKTDILIIFIFLILPFIFFRDSFKLNSVFLGSGDPTAITIPLRQLIIDSIKNFELPFWNRYNFSGYPLLSYFEVSVFYPITFILNLIFPITLSYNLSILVHYSLAGIFMYLFLDEYNLNKFASFTAGLIFMFSGVMITHRSHQHLLYTIIWIPLILLFLEKYRKHRRIEFVFISSIIYSISFFGGHAQVFLYGSFVILIFILFYTFIYNGGKNYYFLLSGLVFLIGILISSIQLIPSYELAINSTRTVIGFGYFSSFSFNPRLLPILFFPFIFGNPFYQLQNVPTYFGPWNYTEMVIYFGITTIPLLVFSFFRKDKHKYLWIFLLILSFFLVLGNHTPLYKLMYYVPLFNKFRVPARNWFEFGLAFSILTGFGFDYFIKLNKVKIRKITLGLIIFFGTVFSVFFVFYFLWQTELKDNLINFLRIPDDKIKDLLQSIKITNYSIFIPLIIIFCTILILSLFLFKKNKILYVLLIALIFLDLYSMGHYYEGNSDNKHIYKNLEDSITLNFLSEKEDLFRILPIAPSLSGYIFCNNKNIHINSEVVTGSTGLLIRDYNHITRINESSEAATDWIGILRNNNVLSMLNTKYIIVSTQDDIDKFTDNITESYWKDTEPIFGQTQYRNAEFNNSWLSADKSEVIISGGESITKLYKVPIDIESNRDYMVSFEIRENKKVDNYIHFDFSGDNYDDPNKEFYLSPDDIGEEYIKISKIINSKDVPFGTDIYFRIFTNSGGEFSVRDLEIHEAVRYYNYKIVYNDGNKLILENRNFIPRFYFVSEVRNVDSLEEAKDILWEEDVFWDYDKFDIKTTALVQDIDFNRRKFNAEDADVSVIEYKNNIVTLETTSEDDSFLIFSDTYYPGWRAYIDNIETKIYRTNGIIKGIYIPKGEHTILFKYVPSYFWIGAIISLSTFVLVVAGIVVLFLRRRK